MKDFVSKITFGFFMAQLLPGAIVVFSVSCVDSATTESVESLIDSGLDKWFSSSLGTAIFLFLSIAIGMIIHGINWANMAWLENRKEPQNPKPIREWRWHQISIWIQLLIAPFIMIGELIYLIFSAPNLNNLTMDENIVAIPSQDVSKFNFLQDFYLHFGQFYAHTGYALFITFVCSLLCAFKDFSGKRLLFAILLYLITSIFFMLGRVTLSSLFKAEFKLRKDNPND